MKRSKKPKQFIKAPVYPGGNKALGEFIRNNLQYPEEALEKGIEGKVLVEFDIDHKGKVTNAKVKNGIGHGCDEEAIRLVSLMQFESIKHRGFRVTFHKTMNIHFMLRNKQKNIVQITYTYKEKNTETKGESYTYTITN